MEYNILKLRELLRQIQPAFLDGMNENIKEFRQLFDRLAKKPDDVPTIENIYRMAHNIHGNGASYGFPAISEIGERMEEALKAVYLHQKRMRDVCGECRRDVLFWIKPHGPDDDTTVPDKRLSLMYYRLFWENSHP